MAARKAKIDYATASLDDLKKELKKLKNTEASIEIALLLREHPEIEDYIYRLMTAVAELRVIEKSVILEKCDVDEDAIEKEKSLINSQMKRLEASIVKYKTLDTENARKLVTTYEGNLVALKAKLETIGLSKTLLKFKERHDSLVEAVALLYAEWTSSDFVESIDLLEALPMIKPYVTKD